MEIKPCPFCGSYNLRIAEKFSNLPTFVYCSDCHACGPHTNETATEAIELWNAAFCPDPVVTGSESTPLNPSNSSGLDTADEIAAKTDLRANVAQLMEEASELITACCKYLRATGSGQPTPVTVDESLAMIGEEAADVHLVTDVIIRQSEAVDDIFTETSNRKILRWKGRLENDRQR